MKTEIKEKIEMISSGKVPEGYKKTKVGIIPEDWKVEQIKNISTINELNLSNDTNKNYEFYYFDLSSVSEGKIFIPENKIKFGDAPSRARRIFNKNDILMSTVRPYLKGFGYIDFEKEGCVCSTGFAVITSNNKYDSKYIYYNIFSENINNQIKKLLVGSSYPAINKKDVERLIIPYSKHYDERKKIAQILSTWDEAIELKEKLIEEKKEQKKGLMQKLLTGEVRLPGFDGEWEKTEFSSIFTRIPVRKHQIKTSEYLDEGLYPVVDQGKEKVIAFSNQKEKLLEVEPEGVIVFGDHTREVKFIDFDFIVGADGTQILKTKEKCNIEFYYQYLLTKRIPDTGYNRHFKFLREMYFFSPPIEEQKAIANILSTADKEIELLEKEVEFLKLQKKGLMQLLLTGIVRVEW